MADWFAKLMHRGRSRTRPGDVESLNAPQDPRSDRIVQMLRDRATEDREARNKRERGYRQSLENDAAIGSTASSVSSPNRLHKFRTKVPCRVTPEARALLDQLRKRFGGCTVTFPQTSSGQQAVMLSGSTHTERRQIGVLVQSVETDPKLCNARNQGLVVDTDGGTMLVLRFRYPLTAVRMGSEHRAGGQKHAHRNPRFGQRVSAESTDGFELSPGVSDEATCVDFSEIRPALDLRPSDGGSSPRLVWLTRSEIETMNAVGSRDFEAFYVRFKLEVQAGIWSSLSTVLSNSSSSQWHRGSHYTVMREPDAANRKICQRTVDDSGRAADIGLDRIYDAAPATDILLLYLESDILADFAEIYFALQSLSSADAYFLKEELFTVIRRFWASAQSLVSRYGSDLATIVRMSQRAVPMPAQAPLLQQDWTNLRQSIVDRYGVGGWKAAGLVGAEVYRPRTGSSAWPFSSFPAGEVNVGLRIVYRQEWRLCAQRGEVIRRVQPTGHQAEPESMAITHYDAEGSQSIETTIEQSETIRGLEVTVDDVVGATVETMKWPRDTEGSIQIGARGLAASTDMGLESECREITRETSARLSDMVTRKLATMIRHPVIPHERSTHLVIPHERSECRDLLDIAVCPESSCATDIECPTDENAATTVYSRLQHRYEVLTRLAEVQNVVLVAEKLPAPAEIDVSWVRRHDWILGKVLLDESFRDALDTIGREVPTAELALDATRNRLCEHLRANILHYQRAIWEREDPQQRCMRYRKSGKKVPLEWRFELESGEAMTIDHLCDRLAATNVDGQFAAYTAGREADLDQVIDAAGPIGYYGNYAIYHMRPELGSEDVFSMLHFFKSPFLWPNPETGTPEIEDPVQIHISENPSVAATLHHDRVRRITLDTDGLVIDVVRRVAPAPAAVPVLVKVDSSDGEGSIDLGEATDGTQLILESGREIELLSANSQWDAAAEWAIRRSDEERMLTLLTGLVGPCPYARNQESETAILVPNDGMRTLDRSAGQGHGATAADLVLAREESGVKLTTVAGGGAAELSAVVVARQGNRERLSDLSAGRAPQAEPVIHARDGEIQLSAIARSGAVAGDGALAGNGAVMGSGAVERREPPLVRRGDGQRAPNVNAGRARDGELTLIGQDRTRDLNAGRAHDGELRIVGRGDGQRTTELRAGWVQDADARPLVLPRADGGPRLATGVGGRGAPAHERVIIAGDNEVLRPSLVAE